MTALLPGFQDQLERRATELAREEEQRVPVYVPHAGRGDRGPRPKRRDQVGAAGCRRRLHGRGLVLALVASVVGAGGVAYAAQQILWQPDLGNDRSGRATATASALPSDMLKAFAVLRRPQTENDRGAGSQFALSMNGKGAVIRTNAVRRLATGLNGGAIVLVPYERKEGMDLEALRAAMNRKNKPKVGEEIPMVVKRDQVCASYLDGYVGAGVACQDLDGLLKGKLSLGIGMEACTTPAARRNFASMQAQERKLAKAEGRPAIEMTCNRRSGAMHEVTFGLVPDGVAAVKFSRSPNGKVVPVRGNVWQSVSGGAFGPKVWLDADGNELSKKLADTKARLGLKG
jgi:hypothetical protein